LVLPGRGLTFGSDLERDASASVKANGGSVLGDVRHPLNTADFSSFLLQAQASKAQIIGLANAGGDTDQAIKQAHEFGLTQSGQKLAALLMYDTDVHAMGLEITQGMLTTSGFYWDRTEATRAFSRRFFDRIGKMPNRRGPASIPRRCTISRPSRPSALSIRRRS
jgi:branched-chain amino acid transport system substrate-binding protein